MLTWLPHKYATLLEVEKRNTNDFNMLGRCSRITTLRDSPHSGSWYANHVSLSTILGSLPYFFIRRWEASTRREGRGGACQ